MVTNTWGRHDDVCAVSGRSDWSMGPDLITCFRSIMGIDTITTAEITRTSVLILTWSLPGSMAGGGALELLGAWGSVVLARGENGYFNAIKLAQLVLVLCCCLTIPIMIQVRLLCPAMTPVPDAIHLSSSACSHSDPWPIFLWLLLKKSCCFWTIHHLKSSLNKSEKIRFLSQSLSNPDSSTFFAPAPAQMCTSIKVQTLINQLLWCCRLFEPFTKLQPLCCR